MAITLTEKAAKHINNQIAKRGAGLALRLGVKRVGCSGLAYTFDFADAIGDTDSVFESHAARIVVDADSLPYLDGTVLDFVREGLKETFKFDNPNVKASCGCGESFAV